MGTSVIIAIVVLLLLLVSVAVWYVWSTPSAAPVTPSESSASSSVTYVPPAPVNPLEVGDLVKYEWQPPDDAVDVCAPNIGKMVAYGAVKKVEGDTVSVRWMLIKNPFPKQVRGWPCCWKRSADNIAWNMKYWGDENTDPTYGSGLKSVAINYNEIEKLPSNYWQPEHSCDKEEAAAAVVRAQAMQAWEASGPLFNCPVDYVQNWSCIGVQTAFGRACISEPGICPGEWGCCNRLNNRRLPPGYTWEQIANTDIGRAPY